MLVINCIIIVILNKCKKCFNKVYKEVENFREISGNFPNKSWKVSKSSGRFPEMFHPLQPYS